MNGVEKRLARVEQALAELQVENLQLRRELAELQNRLADGQLIPIDSETRPVRRAKWSVYLWLGSFVVLLVLAFAIWHLNAFWSTAIAAVIYVAGPGVWRLMMEGLFRAIPGVLLGQTTRIAVDNMRRRRTR